jgi:hypothetical protein
MKWVGDEVTCKVKNDIARKTSRVHVLVARNLDTDSSDSPDTQTAR